MAEQTDPEQGEKFEVFFDAQCPLCKKEIDMVRRLDVNDRLVLSDIADPDFDPSSLGKPLDTLMREIHGRHADGTWVIGVEVFREIYGRVGFAGLTSISRWPVVRSLLELGYKCFAWPRYRLALRRMRRVTADAVGITGGEQCDTASASCRQIAAVSETRSSVTSVD